jgi:hypothetical protein
MRRISMFLPVLCCLAFVVQPSAARDDDAKDKSKEWVEGSVWKGILKVRRSNGEVRTGDVTIIITKRDGKSFEGTYQFEDKTGVLEFEGEVDVAGKMKLTITKLANASDDDKKSLYLRNIVGTKGSGTIDGKSVVLKYVHPRADNPNGAPETGTIKVKLKE